MENSLSLSETDICFGCLSSKLETVIYKHEFQSEALKLLFEVDGVSVCASCRRVAQRLARFVRAVRSHQALLRDKRQVTKTYLEAARAKSKRWVDLTQTAVDTFHLEEDDRAHDKQEIFLVVSRRGHSAEQKVKVEVKQEINELLENFDGAFADEEPDFQESFIKVETITPHDRPVEKARGDRRGGDDDGGRSGAASRVKDVYNIHKVTLTRAQWEAERRERAAAARYAAAPFRCADCVRGFQLKAAYETHLLKHNESAGEYVCELCNMRTSSLEKLAVHVRCHTTRYSCGECGARRSTLRAARLHCGVAHAAHGLQQHACRLCSKTFPLALYLRKHERYQHGARARLSCQQCARSYATKGALADHLLRKHGGGAGQGEGKGGCGTHVCGECGAAFRAPSQLRNHAVKHARTRPHQHYCVECDKSFKSAYSLKHHLKNAAPHAVYQDLPSVLPRRVTYNRHLFQT